MKNYIFAFIGGIVFTVLIAATSQDCGRSLHLMEPVQPESTVILREYYTGITGHSPTLDAQAAPYLKRGYIVKIISTYTYNGPGGYIVLEKY